MRPKTVQPGSAAARKLHFDNKLTEGDSHSFAPAVLGGQMSSLNRAASFVVLFTLILRVPGLSLFPVGALIGLALLPTFWRLFVEMKPLRVIGLVSVLALIGGLLLRAALYPGVGYPGPTSAIPPLMGWLLSFPILVAAGLWALKWWSVRSAVFIALAGGLVGEFLASSSPEWKGDFGILLTMFVLVVLPKQRYIIGSLMVGVSVLVSLTADSRVQAIFGLFVIALFATGPKFADFVRRRTVVGITIVAGISALLINLLTYAMEVGWLGAQIQARSIEQTSRGQSLIAGGRAEWAATFELFAHAPFGFGIGAQVNSGIQNDAMSKFASVGGDYISPYLRTTVFGERVDLHSILADLWFHFGIPGAVLAVVCAVVLMMALPRAISMRNNLGLLVAFAIVNGLWDLLFSPMANVNRVALALFLSCAVLMGDPLKREVGSK